MNARLLFETSKTSETSEQVERQKNAWYWAWESIELLIFARKFSN